MSTTHSVQPGPTAAAPQVDPRGLRFGAWITSGVLVASLLTVEAARPLAIALVAAQAAIFAVGAFLGVRYSPYGRIFARFVRPRLAPPTELEDARPPQFAQLVGFGFAAVALVALLTSSTTVASVALGFALVAALLNAAVGLCLGCEMYLLGRRLTAARS